VYKVCISWKSKEVIESTCMVQEWKLLHQGYYNWICDQPKCHICTT